MEINYPSKINDPFIIFRLFGVCGDDRPLHVAWIERDLGRFRISAVVTLPPGQRTPWLAGRYHDATALSETNSRFRR